MTSATSDQERMCMPDTLIISDAARRCDAIVLERACRGAGPVMWSSHPQLVQQQPLIFLGLLAFWTGRTSFEGMGSPRVCAHRAALAAIVRVRSTCHTCHTNTLCMV
jgi:hypothetical protein